MLSSSDYLKKGYRMDNGNVVTPEFRASYVYVFQPRVNKKKAPKYCCNLLFPVGTDLTILKKAAYDVVVKQFGVDQAVWPKFKSPFKAQDDRVGKDRGYEKGGEYIIPNSNNQPGVVDAAVKPIINPADVYAGCYGVAMVRAYWYDNDQKGVGFELVNFQKTRDGELISNRSLPESGFQSVGTTGDNPPAQGGSALNPFGAPSSAAPTGHLGDIFK